jgi:(1->4)-alpha-D-glucan 1-alpha-D-glucosylmutase
VARRSFAAELTVLANSLQRIALTDRRTRDYSLDDLRESLADVAACMPVYRTYVARSVSPQDARFIDSAIEQARHHSEVNDPTVFDFIRSCLLTAEPKEGAAPADALINRFAMRFQQFASPVAAKGVEDTAFYRYHRLVSLNEVGGTPSIFGTSADAFHAANAFRLATWPHAMLATSTHDNKRSEDVRHRIDVLSEQPAAFRLGLRRWKAAVEPLRMLVDGVPAPSHEDLYLLYQTLLGSLPSEAFEPDELDRYRERVQQYMLKAMREAKCESSWDRPNSAYEQAMQRLIDRVLAGGQANPLLADLQERTAGIAWLGALNSLSATVLKLASPGIPDVYQGTELIDLSLVDPDNRRPVDHAWRQSLLEEFQQEFEAGMCMPWAELLMQSPTDGRLKLWCLWRLLALRNQRPELFASGAYVPLRVRGAHRGSAIAFARRGADATLVVVVARKLAAMNLAPGEWAVRAAWGDTHIARPKWIGKDVEGVDVLTERRFDLGSEALPLESLLGSLSVAALLMKH